MAPKIAVLLSGCGYLDGAAIQEAVLALYFLDCGGAEVRIFAPDREQLHVVDHRSGEAVEGEHRNVLAEASRIARGKIEALSEAKLSDFDGLCLPGGFGAAKNLSDFAIEGADLDLLPEVASLLGDALLAKKPILGICITPVLIAAAAKRVAVSGVKLTIGNDADTAGALEKLGAKHEERPVEELCIDEEHRVITTPAYMYDAGPAAVGAGIEKGVDRLLAWLT